MRLILVLLLASASLAFSQQRQFKNWDKNNDGKLSKDELPKPFQKNFGKVDTNRDGFISQGEHNAHLTRARESQPRPQAHENIRVTPDLSYAANDNPRQMVDLYLPKKPTTDKALPVIVFIHGGAWRAGDKRSGLKRLAPFIASGDYAGVSVAYRLSNEAQWPAQIHDCKAAIRWVRASAKKYNLDPEKIAVWGTSAGGHLVAMLGTSGEVKELEGKIGPHLDQSSRVDAVVNFFGPAEMLTMGDHPSTMDHNAPDSPESLLLGGPILENKEKARSASPITHITKDDPPILNVHGTADALVPYAQSVSFNQKLVEAGVSSNLITITDGGHGNFGKATDQVNRSVSDFLSKHLRLDKSITIKDQGFKAKTP
ncbi:MAG: alpha/beta hydrolase fold domain-containing protein [Akkermansiaceae bacterium]